MRKKTGDTLVEVTIAIGIFSMVAVTVVTLVNNSTSRVQTALETTLAREEIDVQTEAIRFIQNNYVSARKSHQANSDRELFKSIWHAMVDTANTVEEDMSYRPHTCDELYDHDKLTAQKVFVINPTWFGANMSQVSGLPSEISIDDIVAGTVKKNISLFQPTTTYPHIVYSNGVNATMNTQSVEGIYVVAVKEDVPSFGTSMPTYYDFYIRTCWYGLGAKLPSTISTVIRLANPEYLVPAST